MTRPNITTDNAARCLDILKAATDPITAADLGRRLGLADDRETRRRQVRAIVQHLRDQGEWISAKMGGYQLTDDPTVWAEYNASRAIESKRVIGQSHNRNKAALDSRRQGLLFQPPASCGIG